jgi:dTDP-4-amino-4,6-dideoxygalactose transaminase
MKIIKVPLLDLRAQYRSIRDKISSALERFLEAQYFILGPEVTGFEKRLAQNKNR